MSALQEQIDAFLTYLSAERRAAARTVTSYGRDLEAIGAEDHKIIGEGPDYLEAG